MPKITLELTFTSEEIHDKIPYAVICDVLHGHVMTGSERRRFERMFSEEDKEEIEKIKKKAYKWRITTGVPDEVTMTLHEYNLWQMLAEFCIG